MHDVAVHLTSDLLPGLLYTVPADHVTFNRLNTDNGIIEIFFREENLEFEINF